MLEAEITGSLEHPGIVPVYSLGRNAEGRPYYAMRFIRGESLQVAIRRFHKKFGEEPGDAGTKEATTKERETKDADTDAAGTTARAEKGGGAVEVGDRVPAIDRAVPGRLRRDRLRPQPRGAAPRLEAGKHHAGPLWRDAGRRLGAGEEDRHR